MVVAPRTSPRPPTSRRLRDALRRPVAGPPLRELVRPGQTVAISACDGTRPQPRHLMIPAVLDELDGIVRPEDVTVLVATGTHRGNTPAELAEMFGAEVADGSGSSTTTPATTRRCLARQARGRRAGVAQPAWVDADVRITTGFVEPHFFAGFSGGPKMVAPGLAGLETVLTLHDARRIGRRGPLGRHRGQPGARRHPGRVAAPATDFALDVVLNRDQDIVAAFGGTLFAMHAAAIEAARAVRCGRWTGVRRGRHDQLRLPAGPEPLPGGQGDEGRRRRW